MQNVGAVFVGTQVWYKVLYLWYKILYLFNFFDSTSEWTG